MTDDTNELIDKAELLSSTIKSLLAGQGPEVQGAALAELVSVFFAGHHPAIREQSMKHWLKAMRDLIPLSEAELFPHGKPKGWEIHRRRRN